MAERCRRLAPLEPDARRLAGPGDAQFERQSFGALHQMMSKLSATEQEATWSEITQALHRFETGGMFTGPCELLVGVGTKP